MMRHLPHFGDEEPCEEWMLLCHLNERFEEQSSMIGAVVLATYLRDSSEHVRNGLLARGRRKKIAVRTWCTPRLEQASTFHDSTAASTWPMISFSSITKHCMQRRQLSK